MRFPEGLKPTIKHNKGWRLSRHSPSGRILKQILKTNIASYKTTQRYLELAINWSF